MAESQRWFILCVVLVLGGLLYVLEPILFPFLTAALLAYLWDPIVDKLEALGLSRTLGVVIVFLVFILMAALLLFWLLPMLGRQIEAFVDGLPLWLDKLNADFLPWLYGVIGVEPVRLDMSEIKGLLQKHLGAGGSIASQLVAKVSQSGLTLVAWGANLVLIPVVLFYLLRDWDRMIAAIQVLFPRNIEPRVSRWARECDEVLGSFIKGQLLVMFALGLIYAVGLSFVGLDLALLVGLIAGLASIVPYMGFVVGILVASIAAYMQFHGFEVLLWVAVVFAIGQMLEGMVLTPLLVGDKIGLHPVAVIFAVMAGGQLFGFTGVLLALPAAAIIMVLLRHLYAGYKGSGLYGHHQQQPGEQAEGAGIEDAQAAGVESPAAEPAEELVRKEP